MFESLGMIIKSVSVVIPVMAKMRPKPNAIILTRFDRPESILSISFATTSLDVIYEDKLEFNVLRSYNGRGSLSKLSFASNSCLLTTSCFSLI